MAQYTENILKLTLKRMVHIGSQSLNSDTCAIFKAALTRNSHPMFVEIMWLGLILRVGFILRQLCITVSEWLPHSSHQPNTTVPIGERQCSYMRRSSYKISCDWTIWIM